MHAKFKSGNLMTPRGGLRRRLEGKIKTDIKEADYDHVDCIYVV